MAASQTAKLLIQRGEDGRLRCASHPGDQIEGDRIPLLVESLVVVGRRLGLLNIEKYVAALDLADQVEAIKEIYYRISPDVDQSTFFRHKGWDVRGRWDVKGEQMSSPARGGTTSSRSPV
jgi:hypothetical protein